MCSVYFSDVSSAIGLNCVRRRNAQERTTSYDTQSERPLMFAAFGGARRGSATLNTLLNWGSAMTATNHDGHRNENVKNKRHTFKK